VRFDPDFAIEDGIILMSCSLQSLDYIQRVADRIKQMLNSTPNDGWFRYPIFGFSITHVLSVIHSAGFL